VVLLISTLLPWYRRETDIAGALFSEGWNAWQSVPGTAVLLLGLAAAPLGVVAARALGARLGELRTDRVATALGLLALALVALRAVDIPIAEIDTQPGDRSETGRGAGLPLALLGAAAIAYGGRMRA
jgi:hypothetical protein